MIKVPVNNEGGIACLQKKKVTLCESRVVTRKEYRKIFKIRKQDDIDEKTDQVNNNNTLVLFPFRQQVLNNNKYARTNKYPDKKVV